MNPIKLTVVVDNHANPPFPAEHGLSLLLEYGGERILFDVGAGTTLRHNLELLHIDPANLDKLILSHGHYDHTTGLEWLLPLMPQADVFIGAGIDQSHYSLRDDLPIRSIGVPAPALAALRRHPHTREINAFTEIAPGLFLTGPIPRLSGEDCGGNFFRDPEQRAVDTISDEQSLLLAEGVLISGCCHAGVVNTVEYCRKMRPEISIHTIVGGLHLLHADRARLTMTVDSLKKHRVKRLLLLHCTGDEAVAFLKAGLPECDVVVPEVGTRWLL